MTTNLHQFTHHAFANQESREIRAPSIANKSQMIDWLADPVNILLDRMRN